MQNPLFVEPRFKLIHESITLSNKIDLMEGKITSVLMEGKRNPGKSSTEIVRYVMTLAKRQDPLLMSYSMYLAKTIITLKLLKQLLDPKKDRTSIVLKDIFSNVDVHLIKSDKISSKTDLMSTIEQAIDSSFSTRKMKADLRDRVDVLFDKIERKMKSNNDALRHLSLLIKRSVLSDDDRAKLKKYIDGFMEE